MQMLYVFLQDLFQKKALQIVRSFIDTKFEGRHRKGLIKFK